MSELELRPGGPDDELYVGYLPKAPASVARFVRRVVIALFAAAFGLALVLVALESPFGPGKFEFGVTRELHGRISLRPYPLLEQGTGAGEATPHLLVAPGKRGAADRVAGLDGVEVQGRGTLIRRGAMHMIQLAPGALTPVAGEAKRAAAAASVEDLGTHGFVGEIVDAKCFLGVMKPGAGKVHRSCAARCISGGIPPLLWVVGESSEELQLLLVDERGEALDRDEVVPWVGRPVAVEGRVTRREGLLYLHTSPGSIASPGSETRSATAASNARSHFEQGDAR